MFDPPRERDHPNDRQRLAQRLGRLLRAKNGHFDLSFGTRRHLESLCVRVRWGGARPTSSISYDLGHFSKNSFASTSSGDHRRRRCDRRGARARSAHRDRVHPECASQSRAAEARTSRSRAPKRTRHDRAAPKHTCHDRADPARASRSRGSSTHVAITCALAEARAARDHGERRRLGRKARHRRPAFPPWEGRT